LNVRIDGSEYKNLLLYIMAGSNLYPLMYEMDRVFIAIGPIKYLSTLANYQDLVFILGTGGNIALNYLYDPFSFWNKLCMQVVIAMTLLRTLKFIRIFGNFSPIVTMMSFVVKDLYMFLVFFAITLVFCSQIYAILQVPNGEIGGFIKNHLEVFYLFKVFTLSLGDWSLIETANELSQEEVIVLYLMTLTFSTILCIIFLNFVIAQASNSYVSVSESLNEFIIKDRAGLCHEADSMRPNCFKSKFKYPKFLIKRECKQ